MLEHAAHEGRTARDPAELMADPAYMFLHDLPREIAAESIHHVRAQSGTPFRERWAQKRWPDVPTRFLLSRQDRLFPAGFQRRVVRDRLGIAPDEMDGGHLVALSRPVELAERLDASAVQVSAGRSA